MARRSTRLSRRNSATPKRVSLSHDAPLRTPKTAPVKLSTLNENDDIPGAFPQSASPPERMTPSVAPKQQGVKIPVRFNDTTPKQSTPIKPTSDEMHPAQHHHSTAKLLDEARWLGFANMPQTEPPKQSSRIATLQGTPSRTSDAQQSVTAPKYEFTFHREHSLELSPEAKRLMFEKREEAARIREQMIAAGEGPEDVDAAVARKIAMPKGKNGRFSQAHLDQFKKMDSIANHPSAFRANPTWKKASPAEPEVQHQVPQSASKSLKRCPSSAQLDEPGSKPAHALLRSPSKPSLFAGGSGLPRATSSKSLVPSSESRETSPAKRVKRFQGDDATITRPSSSGSDIRQPATPSPVKQQPIWPDLTSLASPTQASIARAASVKSTKSSKIPAPALARSPSKAKLVDGTQSVANPSTPFLARSPSKASSLAHPTNGAAKQDTPSKTGSPLLVRSPVKGPLFKKQNVLSDDKKEAADTSLLSRSPMKMSVSKSGGVSGSVEEEAQHATEEPLLSRSPMKMSVCKTGTVGDEEMKDVQQQSHSKMPLLARSPMKMSIQRLPHVEVGHQAPTFVAPSPSAAKQTVPETTLPTAEMSTKPSNKSLMDRFTFLRSSPMKSILRSPQRLYSDDPAKVAAGTHLATPPKQTASEMNKKLAAVAKTAPNRKQVDFSSSTKARYERAQSEVSSTPSKDTTPSSEAEHHTDAAARPGFAQYPSLPAVGEDLAITPQKRRQTIAPGDFTFRAGPDNIVFGTSLNAPASMAGKKRPSTIRHVSAEPALLASTTKKRKFEFENDRATHEDNSVVPAPVTTSKKRKFEFENGQVAENEAVGAMSSEKENAGGEEVVDGGRPVKRMKQSAPTPERQARRPTLGVRPKGEVKGARSASGGVAAKGIGSVVTKSAGASGAKERKSATISQARLAALAQPKRRG